MNELMISDIQWFSDPLVEDSDAIFKFQTGFTLECDVQTGLGDATSAVIVYKKPISETGQEGLTETGSFSATIVDATAGLIQHAVSSTSDFNVAGDWRLWPKITFANGTIPGRSKLIRVFAEGDD